jgi:hypothetical protein
MVFIEPGDRKINYRSTTRAQFLKRVIDTDTRQTHDGAMKDFTTRMTGSGADKVIMLFSFHSAGYNRTI